jgi:putative tricarboxylic transport membrane protein
VKLSTDRVAGLFLLALAVVVAVQGRTFRVAFLTDPLGPRALPWLVAGMLGGAAVVLIRRPGPEAVWPRRAGLLRAAGGAAVFFLYGLLLTPLGFGTTTAAAVAGMGILFGGPPLRSLASGLVVTGALWLLFVFALGIPLPIGTLFLAGP